MDFSSLLGSLETCTRPGCETKFFPGQDGRTKYCSDLCVVRARQQKGKVDTRPNYAVPTPPVRKSSPSRALPNPQKESRSTALCPQGNKKTFVTASLAWDWIDEKHPEDSLIRPYRCDCGAIHIGHSSPGKRNDKAFDRVN